MTFVVVVPIEVKGEEDNRIVSSKKKKKRVVRKKVTEIILLMREGRRPLHVCVRHPHLLERYFGRRRDVVVV